MKKTALLLLVLIITVLSSCKGKEKQQEKNAIEKIENQISHDYADDSLDSKTDKINKNIISEDGFMGFKIGNKINSESKNLKKSTQKNGEGSFNGYDLLDEKEEKIGFIFPKSDDKEIIDIIEISSPKYKTSKGIGIGSTYQDLKKQYPNIETHGSEIESRTTSNVRGLSFRLDIAFNTYEIDESKIKPSTEIIRISLLDTKN